MAAFFLHPGFLIVAVALVSVPIIIHLINRMRFKRIRWAAMEFLLKAQKRTRRRLIIEQLLLLALRCFMIALVGFLVSRFIGCGDTNLGGKPNLHLVLLDDSPSMQDRWKQDGEWKNCFDVAKNDIILKKIAKGLSVSKTNDQLIILPLSMIDDPNLDLKNVTHERLIDEKNLKKLTEEVNDMQPSAVHTSMLQAVKKAQTIINQHSDSHVTLHLVSDYRDKDWGGPAGEGLMKELLDLAKHKKGEIKIRAIDTVYPQRAEAQGGFPPSRDNVGIVEIRPSTRIVGKNMPVQFTVVLQNYSGALAEVTLSARDERTGKEMFDVTPNPPNPIKISPSSTATVTFSKRFNPDIKGTDSHFEQISVRLTNAQLQELENDGLLADNIRHTVVEVRDKVPILVIDGTRQLGREEGKDSFFISRSLISVPGASYQVVYGDELPGCSGDATKALERADLNKYPTIFLLNVMTLNPKQVKNLENFTREGGGVAFFMGPLVNEKDYNRLLYKGGKGVFPAPLKGTVPPAGEPALEPKGTDTFQLLIRDEKFKGDAAGTPIFGAIFEEPKHREPLRDLPMRRYFQVARSQWKPEPGRVQELATLPNESPAVAFGQQVADITLPEKSEAIKFLLSAKEFTAYRNRLQGYLNRMETIARPGSDARAYHLANQIEMLLNDKGSVQQKDQFPDMTELWANADANVQTVLRQLKNLREDVHYGDPFIVIQNFGKGKVVAIMSTAGKEWNDFAGGSASSILFAPFIWEMQNYLSSQGSEANLTTGTNLDIALDAGQFKGAQLKLVRSFYKPANEKPALKVPHGDPHTGREVGNQILFTMARNNVPGVYVSELIDENAAGKGPIAVYAHAFNIDTANEGDLTRVGSDKLEQEFSKAGGEIILVSPGVGDDKLVSKLNDLSESPWLFLIMLLVLVAEQALAVHLSFHLKKNENELAPAGASQGRASAA